MMAPRSFRSRYSFVVSYARNTACTVVKIRGELRTRFVKMNSKRLPLYFVSTYSAWVLPRSRLCAVLMLSETMQLYPIERFVRRERAAYQIIRRFVMNSSPRSPLLPFVSSTEFIESIVNSPFRASSETGGTSNRISRSCQIWFMISVALDIAGRAPRLCDYRTVSDGGAQLPQLSHLHPSARQLPPVPTYTRSATDSLLRTTTCN